MKNPLVATTEIVTFVQNMIAVPGTLAFPDQSALSVLQDLTLKGRKPYYLSHPEFLEGFELGYQCGLDELEDFDLDHFTFERIIQEIEFTLSHARHEKDLRVCRHFGWQCVHHSNNVGLAFGWLSALLDNGVTFRLPGTSTEPLQHFVSSPVLSYCPSLLQKELV